MRTKTKNKDSIKDIIPALLILTTLIITSNFLTNTITGKQTAEQILSLTGCAEYGSMICKNQPYSSPTATTQTTLYVCNQYKQWQATPCETACSDNNIHSAQLVQQGNNPCEKKVLQNCNQDGAKMCSASGNYYQCQSWQYSWKPCNTGTCASMYDITYSSTDAICIKNPNLLLNLTFKDPASQTSNKAIDSSDYHQDSTIGAQGTNEYSPILRVENNEGTYLFDGQNDYIQTPLTVTQQKFTLSAWVKPQPNPTADAQTIISKNSYYASSVMDFPVSLRTDNTGTSYYCQISKGGDYSIDISVAKSGYTANEWHNPVCTYQNGTLTLYLDGQLADQKRAMYLPEQTYPSINYLPYTIGRDAYEQSAQTGKTAFKGQITNVLLYNKPLTAQEITSAYNNLKTRIYTPIPTTNTTTTIITTPTNATNTTTNISNTTQTANNTTNTTTAVNITAGNLSTTTNISNTTNTTTLTTASATTTTQPTTTNQTTTTTAPATTSTTSTTSGSTQLSTLPESVRTRFRTSQYTSSAGMRTTTTPASTTTRDAKTFSQTTTTTKPTIKTVPTQPTKTPPQTTTKKQTTAPQTIPKITEIKQPTTTTPQQKQETQPQTEQQTTPQPEKQPEHIKYTPKPKPTSTVEKIFEFLFGWMW